MIDRGRDRLRNFVIVNLESERFRNPDRDFGGQNGKKIGLRNSLILGNNVEFNSVGQGSSKTARHSFSGAVIFLCKDQNKKLVNNVFEHNNKIVKTD